MKYICKSIANAVENIITKEKGSKFIGYAYPVKTEEEVKEKLNFLKEKYPDATHHCYAYRLGFEGENYRANDDGEPNGTAGLPIYNQLLSNDLTFCLVISIRYFGGTKLGVSGLIKAYKESAELTLQNATSKTIVKKRHYQIDFSYTDNGVVMRNAEKFNAKIVFRDYQEECSIKVSLPLKKAKDFENSFNPYNNINLKPLD